MKNEPSIYVQDRQCNQYWKPSHGNAKCVLLHCSITYHCQQWF